MKQVVQSARSGSLKVKNVPAPRVRPGTLLVRTRASLISTGTERMVVDFARKSLVAKAGARPDLVRKVLENARRDGIGATLRAVMARLDEPLPLGYSAAGEVAAIGAGLEGRFRIGQHVAAAGAGIANHAELNVVPGNLAAPVPDGVGDQEACFATVGAIALHGVRNLGVGLGDVVAVIGVGLVGQLALQLLKHQGARVIAADYNPTRLALAARMGAEQTWNLAEPGLAEAVSSLTRGLGVDAILVAAATDSSGPLETAAEIARDRARVCLIGKTGTEFSYAGFMTKELSLVVSRSYGPGRYDEDFEDRGMAYPPGYVRWTETENLRECVRLMSPDLPHRLDVTTLITHRFSFESAEDAYALILGNTEPHLGVILQYDPAEVTSDEPLLRRSVTAAARPGAPACTLAVIGAGRFARTVLLPELKRIRNVRLHTIVTRRGISADFAADSFGFTQVATDPLAAIRDPEVNAVLIATRHDSHAKLTVRALEAGKAVFVEKPLALDREQLTEVLVARQNSPGFFTIGFNRRFAPMARRAREHLAARAGPKFVILRVNAGAVPPQSWIHEAGEGGGRILGEVCHFVDLARYLVGAEIVSVQADNAEVLAGSCDNVTATLQFVDGSLAIIAYTALGETSFSKERIEVFAGGTVVIIDNFRQMTVTTDGRTRTEKSRGGQDKGHRAELKAFVRAVTAGGPAPVNEDELVESSVATIAVLESLREGRRVDLRADWPPVP